MQSRTITIDGEKLMLWQCISERDATPETISNRLQRAAALMKAGPGRSTLAR